MTLANRLITKEKSMALNKIKFINDVSAVTVNGSKVMMVYKPNRFMILPSNFKNQLNDRQFSEKILADMEQSAFVCRESLQESDVHINLLKENILEPFDDVEILRNINRVNILRHGKTFSFAKYVDGWNLKIFPRYGLEDGVYTPNIGMLPLPNVFGVVIENMFQANSDRAKDWKEFFVLCFDQYLSMITSLDK